MAEESSIYGYKDMSLEGFVNTFCVRRCCCCRFLVVLISDVHKASRVRLYM